MTALFGKKHDEKHENVSPTVAVKKNATDVRLLTVLTRPLVTEKGTRQNALNQYAFVVANTATKNDIRAAVQAIYGVKPVHVTTAHVRGKKVRYGRSLGTTKAWKKAIVTLKEGDKIQVYEGV